MEKPKKDLIRITPDSEDATKDFVIDQNRIASVEARGLAAWSTDDDSKQRMLRRFAERVSG